MPQTATMRLEDAPDVQDEEEENEAHVEEINAAEGALLAGRQSTLSDAEKQDPRRVIEAALFIGNRKFTFAELAILSKEHVRTAQRIVDALAKEYASRDSSIELAVDAEGAMFQVKSEFLNSVSSLSKNVELSRKSLRILALIAKKGKILQSELRKYFRGDVYEYIAELKDLGYVVSLKSGNTRLLKPTTKFHETFQLATNPGNPVPAEALQGEAKEEHPPS